MLGKIGIKRVGQWGSLLRFLRNAYLRFDKAMNVALAKEANLWARSMKLVILNGAGMRQIKSTTAWAKNRTKFGRGANKPLLATGDLLNSIRAERVGPGKYFAGALRKKRNRRGRSMADVAEIQEFGSDRPILIKVTKRMHNFFWAMAKFNKGKLMDYVPRVGSTVRVTIPERRFARPVYEELAKGSSKRVMDEYMRQVSIGPK